MAAASGRRRRSAVAARFRIGPENAAEQIHGCEEHGRAIEGLRVRLHLHDETVQEGLHEAGEQAGVDFGHDGRSAKSIRHM